MYVRNALRRISNLNFFHCLNQQDEGAKKSTSNNWPSDNKASDNESPFELELDFNRYIEKSLPIISKNL